MTILATLETVDPVTDAIRAHLNNPSIPVIRICKDHEVSRATFYRKLKALDLQPKAAFEPKYISCSNGCGTSFPEAVTDNEAMRHVAYECCLASPELKSQAQQIVQAECSVQPKSICSISSFSETSAQTPASQESLMTSFPSASQTHSRDEFYDAKFDGNNDVRPGWNYAAWTLNRVADIKPFSTKDCRTVTRPRGVRK